MRRIDDHGFGLMRLMPFIRYELDDGRHIALDAEDVRRFGAAEVLRRIHGIEVKPDTRRLPVLREGRTVGTLPADLDPDCIRSRTFLYDPRPGDFRREGDTWIAARNLGPGDLEAVPGFERSAPSDPTTPETRR